MRMTGIDTLDVASELVVDGKTYRYFSLPAAGKKIGDISRLPVSLKILLENVLRFENGGSCQVRDAEAFRSWVASGHDAHEIPFRPARILMQDFTGVPAIVDLASMRDGIVALGGDPAKVNPLVPVDLVIDHSVIVDVAGDKDALEKNMALEFKRNAERYAFLRWGQNAFENFRVVPPGQGICHQVNLEYLSQVVWTRDEGDATYAFPDTVYGTDSHTTMVNGVGVLGWGVGGIEAEAAMLGQPISMVLPDVIGVRLEGRLSPIATATDLVLTITQMLRAENVVGKFVEFYGPALDTLPLADRATIANMAPEYGATCGFFPVDDIALAYLEQTGRDPHRIALTRAYLKAQGMYRDADAPEPVFTKSLTLDLADVQPAISGPKRPQDLVPLSQASANFYAVLERDFRVTSSARVKLEGREFDLGNGDIVIAAITSCTNTSNPEVMIAAGLLARKAHELGLRPKPWVKTSLAPGSQVVTDYLDRAGLTPHLDALGFETVGYGCTTCIGNSGPLAPEITAAIEANGLVVASVLSGNRNFEGRISLSVKANYLASPPLVVAYALLGSMCQDITKVALGKAQDGREVFLRDLWPSREEIETVLGKAISRDGYAASYKNIFEGTSHWQKLAVAASGQRFAWDDSSTYIHQPPYFENLRPGPGVTSDIKNARILAILGDNITTDHISPAGAIKASSPAGRFLMERGVDEADFNSYGSRRGNDLVMVRGAFANTRIRNRMIPGVEGGMTRILPDGEIASIYDVAQQYRARNIPLIVMGGKEYGMGSSRDWAAKGTLLLGVKAVIAESFERIHRSNLVGMGVLPLVFPNNVNAQTLQLDGSETITLSDLTDIKPRMTVWADIMRTDGRSLRVDLICRIDTEDEVEYYRHGGILPYVLRGMTKTD